ncbi:MAG: PASTA domain-containing protein [Actinomycetota bacterium]
MTATCRSRRSVVVKRNRSASTTRHGRRSATGRHYAAGCDNDRGVVPGWGFARAGRGCPERVSPAAASRRRRAAAGGRLTPVSRWLPRSWRRVTRRAGAKPAGPAAGAGASPRGRSVEGLERGSSPSDPAGSFLDREEVSSSTLQGLAAGLESVAGWLGSRGPSSKVVVPEFVAMHVSDTFLEAARAGVRTRVVRVARDPAPVDGVVVDQRPPAGTRVRRGSTVVLSVWHPEGKVPAGPGPAPRVR